MAMTANFDPELAVVEAARGGDRTAFADMVRANDRWIRGVIFGVLGRQDTIDDVAQQVWTNAWLRMGELRDLERWRPWLYRLARNAAIDAGRSSTRQKALVAEAIADPALRPSVESEAGNWDSDTGSLVFDAVRSLPEIYREPFVLRHLQDWSYREIAEVMDIPVDTVETRLVRARRLLRESLGGKV